MDEPLGDEFDVIIVGTGLSASVLSGALSRINKKVLHLDRNDYYGGSWASFNIKSIEEFLTKPSEQNPEEKSSTDFELNENEEFVKIIKNESFISGNETKCYLPSKPQTVESENPQAQVEADATQTLENQANQTDEKETEKTKETEIGSGDEVSSPTSDESSKQEPTAEKEEQNVEEQNKKENRPSEPIKPSFPFQEELYKQWRHYNLDLAPKVMFSRGVLVELLIKSNVSRYLEFRNITRTLTFLGGKEELQRVPCSRADVFSSKFVTVVEKRILMRLFTLCHNYKDHEKEYEAFKDKPFMEFLQSRKLSRKAQNFVLHSIAMVTEQTSTLDGLAATQKFLHSLGRYGNSAFLWPSYGVGEIPQAFCRFSAVFGGTFCLRRYVAGYIKDKTTGRCVGVMDNTGQKILCDQLVLDDLNHPESASMKSTNSVDRAIFITNSTVSETDTEQVSLVTIPPSNNNPSVRLIEVGSLCSVCPKNQFVVHAIMERPNGVTESPKERFKLMEDMVFVGNATDQSTKEPESGLEKNQPSKPVVLWSGYFTMTDSQLDCSALPPNVTLLQGPGYDLGFDRAMNEARDVFEKICPGEDFLPRAPDPEEIVFDDEGYNTENNGAIPDALEDVGDYAEEEKMGEEKEEEEVGEEQEEEKVGEEQEEGENREKREEIKEGERKEVEKKEEEKENGEENEEVGQKREEEPKKREDNPNKVTEAESPKNVHENDT